MGCVCGKEKDAKSGPIAKLSDKDKDCPEGQKEELIVVDDFSGGSDDDGGLEVFGQAVQAGYEGNLGLQRFSRLSSQFLPPSGCKITQVPEGNFELRYSFLSQRGYYPEALDKANQDSFCVHTHFGKNPNDHFFGVFDGHGEFGAQCSQFAKRYLCDNLLRHRSFTTDVVQAYHGAFLTTNSQLHRAPIDDSMSGTTAITVLVRGKTLYVANVGDSRAVLAEWKDDKLTAVDLSSDQTPFRQDECERVKKCGARVLTLDQLEGLKSPAIQCWGGEGDDDGDPPRLWVPNGMYPGTAFTRSIGDTVAERIGVIAVPEVTTQGIGSAHPFFVIASDGVFEFLSSQDVVDMVAKYNDPRDACAAVVAESYRLWLQYETRTDDITIIVVNIDGLQEGDTRASFIEDEDHFQPNARHNSNSYPQLRAVPSHELSARRLRAIEASLEHLADWEPPSDQEPKTNEEKARISHALQGNFLFHNLSEKQWETLYNCFVRVKVEPGDLLIRQGSEDDHFYIVESGEFEVLVAQEGNQDGNDLGTVVNHYTAQNSPCFGELALMYNKPRQASVRAVAEGTVWMLTREAFRSLLLMNTRRPALKYLRSIEVLARLNVGQLVRLADSLSDVQFQNGEEIASQFLYIIRKGSVDLVPVDSSGTVRKTEGEFFGESVLANASSSLRAVAVGDVQCWAISKETFESAVGPLDRIIEDDVKLRQKMLLLRKEQMPKVDASLVNTQLRDLAWQETVYNTDCCEVGLVILKTTGQPFTIKRYTFETLKALGREPQVLQEKTIMQELSPSPYVPQVLCTCADDKYAGMLLNCCLAGPLALVLHSPVKEESARYICASVVLALEFLHKDNLVYRGVSPDILMLDRKGRLQLIDFRFAKKLLDDRTYTVCGMADFLAPEMIRGQGHSFAVDWWALGVLVYYMLQNELPFGSWRDSELDIYSRIAGRQLAFPSTFSSDVVDLIDKLLLVDPSSRLGSNDRDDIKRHPWFQGFDWEALLEYQMEVPSEIVRRLQAALKVSRKDVKSVFQSPESREEGDEAQGAPLWLESW